MEKNVLGHPVVHTHENFGNTSKIAWNQLIIVLTKEVISRIIFSMRVTLSFFHAAFHGISLSLHYHLHSVEMIELYYTLLSRFFGKYSVKATFLLKEITKWLIWRNIFSVRVFLGFQHCAFLTKLSSNQFFIEKSLISRNIYQIHFSYWFHGKMIWLCWQACFHYILMKLRKIFSMTWLDV